MAVTPTLESFLFDGQQDTAQLGLGHSAPFPLALKPIQYYEPTLQESIAEFKRLADSGAILEQVRKHGGAALIRGLPIKTSQDFSELAHAFGFPPHEEVGRPPLRAELAKNIKTSNEGRV
jgi:hypothetical protein